MAQEGKIGLTIDRTIWKKLSKLKIDKDFKTFDDEIKAKKENLKPKAFKEYLKKMNFDFNKITKMTINDIKLIDLKGGKNV